MEYGTQNGDVQLPADPVELAHVEAVEAVMDLNTTPAGDRTPEAIARATELSDRAAFMAIEANTVRAGRQSEESGLI